MKLTPELKKYLGRECYIYCSRLNLPIPKIVYTDKELKQIAGLPNTEIKERRIHDIGTSWAKGQIDNLDTHLIYLNVECTDYLSQIIDTLVHELLHLKYPNKRHGIKFQNMINEVMINR